MISFFGGVGGASPEQIQTVPVKLQRTYDINRVTFILY